MRPRKDIDEGKERTPKQVWATYRLELYRELVDSLMLARLRDGIAPSEEASPA